MNPDDFEESEDDDEVEDVAEEGEASSSGDAVRTAVPPPMAVAAAALALRAGGSGGCGWCGCCWSERGGGEASLRGSDPPNDGMGEVLAANGAVPPGAAASGQGVLPSRRFENIESTYVGYGPGPLKSFLTIVSNARS